MGELSDRLNVKREEEEPVWWLPWLSFLQVKATWFSGGSSVFEVRCSEVTSSSASRYLFIYKVVTVQVPACRVS